MAPTTSTSDFEAALRAQLHAQFLGQLPPSFLKLRVGEFLLLAGVDKATHFLAAETPKTATRRSTRVSAAISSITDGVKKRLFAFATPSKGAPLERTPHLTIKSSASVAKAQAVAHTPSRRTAQTPRSTVPQSSRVPAAQPVPSTPSTLVQFQLDDGKLVDVDFSRSPESALQEANLLGSESIGEVKAKIETYANQFMQYLKFFKKFKPSK